MKDDSEIVERTPSGLLLALVGFAVLASAGALVWNYTLQNRLEKSSSLLAGMQEQNDKLAENLNETNARLSVATESLGRSVGLTQRQLETRANELLKKQQADALRLENEQVQSRRQIGAVSGEVSTVKTDVGGVKTDVAQTRTELQGAEAKLQSMTGDLGVQSGLIATNSKELEILKQKGDRNYYDVKLNKGGKPVTIAGITLLLKKADPKHSRYTLIVGADDRKIEKKNKQLDEPVQFYNGRDNLYELLINQIDKKQVIGYLATPKSAFENASRPALH